MQNVDRAEQVLPLSCPVYGSYRLCSRMNRFSLHQSLVSQIVQGLLHSPVSDTCLDSYFPRQQPILGARNRVVDKTARSRQDRHAPAIGHTIPIPDSTGFVGAVSSVKGTLI